MKTPENPQFTVGLRVYNDPSLINTLHDSFKRLGVDFFDTGAMQNVREELPEALNGGIGYYAVVASTPETVSHVVKPSEILGVTRQLDDTIGGCSHIP